MSKQAADISAVGRWVLGNSLPWSDGIEAKLLTLGVTCVEHLKECTDKEWTNLFVLETTITRRVATRVFAALKKEGEFNPKKCASQLGIIQAKVVPPPLSSLSRRGRNTDDGTSFKLTAKGITVKYISKATKKRMRLATFAAARAAVAEVMDDVGEGLHNLLDDGLLGGAHSSGGARGAEDGLDSVSVPDGGEADETGGVQDDNGDKEGMLESDEEEDTEGERTPRLRTWRDERCMLSKDLNDPAPSDERLTWDRDLVGLDDGGGDLEDPDGYYKIMGCSKSSSDDEIGRQHKRMRKKFRMIALKCHPDKTKDTKRHARFLRADAIWSCVQRAMSVLGEVDESGCYALRVKYDRAGEMRRNMMEEVRNCVLVLLMSITLTSLFLFLVTFVFN